MCSNYCFSFQKSAKIQKNVSGVIPRTPFKNRGAGRRGGRKGKGTEREEERRRPRVGGRGSEEPPPRSADLLSSLPMKVVQGTTACIGFDVSSAREWQAVMERETMDYWYYQSRACAPNEQVAMVRPLSPQMS